MHVLINVKSPNNISKWQMGSDSAFKGLIRYGLLATSWSTDLPKGSFEDNHFETTVSFALVNSFSNKCFYAEWDKAKN
jgi:hypothetical protein